MRVIVAGPAWPRLQSNQANAIELTRAGRTSPRGASWAGDDGIRGRVRVRFARAARCDGRMRKFRRKSRWTSGTSAIAWQQLGCEPERRVGEDRAAAHRRRRHRQKVTNEVQVEVDLFDVAGDDGEAALAQHPSDGAVAAAGSQIGPISGVEPDPANNAMVATGDVG